MGEDPPERVYAQLVQTDGEGYKSIDYGRLTVLLVEAIKEQQALIEGLSARVAAMERKMV